MAKRLAVALLLLVLLASGDGSELDGKDRRAGNNGVGELKAPVAGLPVPDLPLLPPNTGTVTAPVVSGIPPVRPSAAAAADNKSPWSCATLQTS